MQLYSFFETFENFKNLKNYYRKEKVLSIILLLSIILQTGICKFRNSLKRWSIAKFFVFSKKLKKKNEKSEKTKICIFQQKILNSEFCGFITIFFKKNQYVELGLRILLRPVFQKLQTI